MIRQRTWRRAPFWDGVVTSKKAQAGFFGKISQRNVLKPVASSEKCPESGGLFGQTETDLHGSAAVAELKPVQGQSDIGLKIQISTAPQPWPN